MRTTFQSQTTICNYFQLTMSPRMPRLFSNLIAQKAVFEATKSQNHIRSTPLLASMDAGNQMPVTPRRRSRSRSPRPPPCWADRRAYPAGYEWMQVRMSEHETRYWTIIDTDGMYPGSWTIWWFHHPFWGYTWKWMSFGKYAEIMGLTYDPETD